MKKIAIIPARGGSKRIPKKNLKDFHGKPILQYSIDVALKSKLFDEVMVSTEDEEIAEIAKQAGASVPFLRSKETADDHAIMADVLIEVLNKYKEQDISFDYCCCLMATAPFITVERLEEAYKVMTEGQFDSVIPMIPFPVPVQTAFRINPDGTIEMFLSKQMLARTQDYEESYYDSGQFYWMKPESVIKVGRIANPNTGTIILPETEAHDIDTLEDWELAELKYEFLKNKGMI